LRYTELLKRNKSLTAHAGPADSSKTGTTTTKDQQPFWHINRGHVFLSRSTNHSARSRLLEWPDLAWPSSKGKRLPYSPRSLGLWWRRYFGWSYNGDPSLEAGRWCFRCIRGRSGCESIGRFLSLRLDYIRCVALSAQPGPHRVQATSTGEGVQTLTSFAWADSLILINGRWPGPYGRNAFISIVAATFGVVISGGNKRKTVRNPGHMSRVGALGGAVPPFSIDSL
jgi:hypothetical protein